jgi:hypothetical protein
MLCWCETWKTLGIFKMATTRDKRLFFLAEHMAAELNKSKGDVQPEDIVGFMQCYVPMTPEEAEEDFDEAIHEHQKRAVGRGTSAIGRLRKSLGFVDGDSIISVMEKAAEFIEGSLANERSVDQMAFRDAASSGKAELAVRDVSRQSVVAGAST